MHHPTDRIAHTTAFPLELHLTPRVMVTEAEFCEAEFCESVSDHIYNDNQKSKKLKKLLTNPKFYNLLQSILH